MNCPQCQAESAPDSAFCGNCGARLAPAAATSPQPGAGFTPGYTPGQYPPPGGVTGAQPMGSVPPASLDLNRLTTVDRIVFGATLITMISIWLPWFTGSVSILGVTDSESVSGTGYHGWLWLEFVVALVLLGYLAARALWQTLPVRVPIAHAPLLIAGTGLQLLLILIGFFEWPSSTVYDGITINISLSVGAFLGLIFAIVAAAPVIVPAVRSYLQARNAAGGSRSF